MAYWISSHFPHPNPDSIPWHLYFRSQPKTVPAVGDFVLFYETHVPHAGGKHAGRKAIVSVAVVSGELTPINGTMVGCLKFHARTTVPAVASRFNRFDLSYKDHFTGRHCDD